MRDYQQYITGERIDGMFSAVGLIGTVISLATSFVLPALYDFAGLNETVLQLVRPESANVYDVLYDPYYFVRVSTVLVVASVVGAIMNVIPYFFYDLTESRQKAIVAVLKIRALFEDYGNGLLREDKMGEAVQILRDADRYDGMTPAPLQKVRGSHAEKKAARRHNKAVRETREQIEIAALVKEELRRFDTPEGKAALQYAEKMAEAGLDGFLQVPVQSLAEARAMPRKTPEEKARRREAIALADKMETAKKTVAKHFQNGIVPFDNAVLERLFDAEDAAEQKLHDLLMDMKAAKTAKDKAKVETLRQQVKAQRAEKTKVQRDIQKATDEHALYYRAAQPFLDAQKLLRQRGNYTHLDEILARYEAYETAAAQS